MMTRRPAVGEALITGGQAGREGEEGGRDWSVCPCVPRCGDDTTGTTQSGLEPTAQRHRRSGLVTNHTVKQSVSYDNTRPHVAQTSTLIDACS